MIKLFEQLLKAVIEENATDLHIVAGEAPVLRVNGRMMRVKMEKLLPDQTKSLCYSILNETQKSRFEETKELDFSFSVKKLARFRANLFVQQGNISGAFRRVPYTVPTFSDLGLPPIVGELIHNPNGLILVTGPTGSGKSSTIAALIDKINMEKYGHIVTIEDPVEYLHTHKNCIVNQREVGPDTWSFQAALRSLLRQDPDYCLIGELRDAETIETALRLSETGHLVFATLHTNSAIQTMNRVITMFPANQQDQIRGILSFVIQGIVSQRLIPGKKGRQALALEVLLPTSGVRSLIRENKLHQVQGMMQVGQARTGMITMNQSLLALVVSNQIDMKVAFEHSPDPEDLDRLMKKAGV